MDEATRQGEQAIDDRQRDPEQIRADIEQTRRQVGDTAAALAEKADVKARAQEKIGEVKERASFQASQADETARRNPVPLVLGGVALAMFVLWRVRR